MLKKREVTIYDIAKKLGLAPSTVSRGLKGHHTVSLKTQKTIVSAAESMGYRSNTFAVNLRRQRSNTIGVIIPKLNSNFMANVLAGIEHVISNAGYSLIISQSLEDTKKEANNVNTMFNSRVDGLLVSVSEKTENTKHFSPFLSRNIPVIFFDRVPIGKDLLSVVINNAEAAYTITNHLIEQGAKKIAHITGNQACSVYRERFKGYLKALKESNIEYDNHLLFINDLGEEAGIKTAMRIIELKADAIFVANDICAAGCMHEMKRLGIRIPTDILIAGFNNDIISRNIEPDLTTINYPGYQMGETTARRILEQLEGNNDTKVPKKITLKTNLIVRSSSLIGIQKN